MIYRWLNRVCEYFNRCSPILVLTPYSRNIGNCAEEIYFGLLKARREGKRALFLFPRPLFWKFRVEVANRALLAIESDHCVRNDSALGHLAGWLLTMIFFCLRQLYLRPRQVIRRLQHMRSGPWAGLRSNIFYVIPSVGRATLWQPDDVQHFSWAVMTSCRWKEQHEAPLPVRLRPEDQRRAEQLRATMGVPLDGWYVCLHVREGGFQGDWRTGVHRNCSILNYIEGIRAITDAGGFVVRLGDDSMRRLPDLGRVIDYPHTAFKSELMDVYLVSQCRFYIGMNSGPLCLAWLFHKHVVMTNLSEWTMTFPKLRGDLAIIKHIFSRSRQRFLSLRELLGEPFECQGVREIGSDYVMVENTPEEIRDVIVEHLNTREVYEYSLLQEAFNEGRRAQIRRWLEHDVSFAGSGLDDSEEKYHLAAHGDASEGALGQRYVEQNWLKDRSSTRTSVCCAPILERKGNNPSQ